MNAAFEIMEIRETRSVGQAPGSLPPSLCRAVSFSVRPVAPFTSRPMGSMELFEKCKRRLRADALFRIFPVGLSSSFTVARFAFRATPLWFPTRVYKVPSGGRNQCYTE